VAMPAVTATPNCAAPPPRPDIPDGASMNPSAFGLARTTFNTWIAAINSNLTCRANEVASLQAQTTLLVDEYHSERSAGEAAVTSMQAQADANMRHPSGPPLG